MVFWGWRGSSCPQPTTSLSDLGVFRVPIGSQHGGSSRLRSDAFMMWLRMVVQNKSIDAPRQPITQQDGEMLWEELAPPSHACTMGSTVANRHQNLSAVSQEKRKILPSWLLSASEHT